MAVLVNRTYLQASPSLATDLARYGTTAQWRGVYYRGEKIGYTVSQVERTDDGFELLEDGRLQFSLLGATTAAILRTSARVDRSFTLKTFEFSLDPGTGPLTVRGRLEGLRLSLDIISASGTRSETRDLSRTAGPDAESRTPARDRRPGGGRPPRMDGLRPGDHEERAGATGDRRPRGG